MVIIAPNNNLKKSLALVASFLGSWFFLTKVLFFVEGYIVHIDFGTLLFQ
jgi:hypothetical protein